MNIALRSSRSPTSEAGIVLTNLDDFYKRLVALRNGITKKKLIEGNMLEDAPLAKTEFFRVLVLDKNAPSGDQLVDDFNKLYPANSEGIFVADEMHMLAIALVFCAEAMRFDKAGETGLAWTLVVDAAKWHGRLLSLQPARLERLNKRVDTSKKLSSNAAKNTAKFKPHVDFIVASYRSGDYKNPRQAAPIMKPLLKDHIKQKSLWPMSESNMEGWIRTTLYKQCKLTT